MASWKIDPLTHDYVTDANGYQLIVTESAEAAQKVEIRLETRKKEWVFDIEMGIDFDRVLVKNPDLRLIRSFYAEETQKVSEVRAIRSLELDLNKTSRTLNINMTASTIYSTGIEVSI